MGRSWNEYRRGSIFYCTETPGILTHALHKAMKPAILQTRGKKIACFRYAAHVITI